MNILLTGSTGFIGRILKESWQNQYQLSAPSRQELDLLDADAVERCLRDGRFDTVVHCCNTNDVVHPELASKMLEYNLRMFFNLERCSRLYGKLYYFGSGAEYDMRHYVPRMKENYFGAHIPADPYGFSKYVMSKQAGGNIYDLRLFGVFGPGEEWQRRFISNMIYQALHCGVMHMDRHMYFDYLYTRDLVKIMDWFLAHEPRHHHYNVCSGQENDLFALARIIQEETGTHAEIVLNGPDWKPAYSGSNERLETEMGKMELTPLRAAVREMISWYLENGFTEKV